MILGIDFGTRKVGLAIGDISSGALPLSVFSYKNLEALQKELLRLQEEYQLTGIVIGTLPDEKAGDEKKREQTKAFQGMVESAFSIPIHYVDEQRSTQAAKSYVKDYPDVKIKNDDALAAQVILQTYFDAHGG